MIGSLPLDAPELEGALSPALAAIEARLLEVVSNADETINPPTSHLAEAGGKRLRPILTLLTAQEHIFLVLNLEFYLRGDINSPY